MAKREKQCKISGCELDVYIEGKCYRHFKTEDRLKDSEGDKAQGRSGDAKKEQEKVSKYPAGVKAADVNPAREDSVAPNDPLDEDKK